VKPKAELPELLAKNDKYNPEGDEEDYIPCLYLPCETPANKLALYFHGNAEDVGLAFEMLTTFGEELKMHVLAVEYPGYGLYKDKGPDENFMREDAEYVYDYLTEVVGVRQEDIVLWGRSMGTGPASYLASIKSCHSCVLMSGFTSIKDVAKDVLGWASFMAFAVIERFPNIEHVANAKCPMFIMHGVQD
jgi:pimeloyl-ACP methyl ester carboxylesterase